MIMMGREDDNSETRKYDKNLARSKKHPEFPQAQNLDREYSKSFKSKVRWLFKTNSNQ